MTNLLTRFRLIFVPFLVIALSYIAAYTLLDYIFVIRMELPVNDELVHYWLAVGLVFIPLLIWLRPRIKLLGLADKKGNLPFLYLFIAAFAIIAPTIVAQDYLATATGKLTILNKISEINRQPLTKYFELKQHFIDKQHIAVHDRAEVSGKNNENLTFYIDVACPILDSQPKTDTVSRQIAASDSSIAPLAWLGIEFSKEMNNNLSRDEENSKFKAFASTVDTEFVHKDLDNFIYLDRLGANDRHKAYLKAVNSKYASLSAKPVIFEAVNEPFEARNGGKLGWIFKSFDIGALVWLIMILIPKLKTEEIDKLPEHVLMTNLSAVYKAAQVFNNKSKFQVTAIIVAINVLVFVAMVFSGLGFMSFESSDLLKWGGDFQPLTYHGQWWRLITSTFVHEGLMHLLLNMYGLFFAAIFVEPALGKMRYASTYLICGIVASVASMWWHNNAVAVGASGAIFGLYGVLIALLVTNKAGLKWKNALLIFSLVFVGLNLVMGLKGNSDNAAHIGGLLAGFVIGCLFSFFGSLPAKEEEDMNTTQDDHTSLTEEQTT